MERGKHTPVARVACRASRMARVSELPSISASTRCRSSSFCQENERSTDFEVQCNCASAWIRCLHMHMQKRDTSPHLCARQAHAPHNSQAVLQQLLDQLKPGEQTGS